MPTLDRCCTCGQEIKHFMPARVSLENNTFVYGARTVKLTGSEAVVVHKLLARKGGVVPSEDIYDALWGQGKWPKNSGVNLSLFIRNVRQKLDSFGVKIKNEQAIGYYIPPTPDLGQSQRRAVDGHLSELGT